MGACQSTSVEIVESRGRGYSLASPQSIREADLIYSAGPLTREEIFSRIESSRENIDFSTGDHTFLGAYLTQRGYYPDDMEKENQDSYSFHNKFGKDTGTSFFAVYDGHGKDGHLVSQYTRKYLPKDIVIELDNKLLLRDGNNAVTRGVVQVARGLSEGIIAVTKRLSSNGSGLARNSSKQSLSDGLSRNSSKQSLSDGGNNGSDFQATSSKGDKNRNKFELYPATNNHPTVGNNVTDEEENPISTTVLNRYSTLTDEEMLDSLRQAHIKCNERLRSFTNIQSDLAGTTSVSCIINNNKVYVSNLGDSRAIIIHKDGSVSPLSRDQTPYRKDERERCRKSGARILTMDQLDGYEPIHDDWDELTLGEDLDLGGDPPRLWHPKLKVPGTAFTRSIGDFFAETLGVYADPEILVHELTPNDEYIVVCSDGVFEFLTNIMVANIVKKFPNNPYRSCQELVKVSYEKWLAEEVRTDDITAIVVKIKDNISSSSSINNNSNTDSDSLNNINNNNSINTMNLFNMPTPIKPNRDADADADAEAEDAMFCNRDSIDSLDGDFNIGDSGQNGNDNDIGVDAIWKDKSGNESEPTTPLKPPSESNNGNDNSNSRSKRPRRSVIIRNISCDIVEKNTSPLDVDITDMIVKKTPDDIKIIESAIGAHFLFQNINSSQKQSVIDVMQPMRVKKGQYIITQGEMETENDDNNSNSNGNINSGDHFYIVKTGKFEVRQDDKVIHTYYGDSSKNHHPGFGELSLLYNKPRAASVVAIEDNSELFCLNRKIFKRVIIKNGTSNNLQSLIKCLRLIQHFRCLDLTQLQKLSLTLSENVEKYQLNDMIATQDDVDDKLYIIIKGHIEIGIDNGGSVKGHRLLPYNDGEILGPGSCCGVTGIYNKEFINSNKRLFSLKAMDDVIINYITINKFLKLFNDFDLKTLQENFQKRKEKQRRPSSLAPPTFSNVKFTGYSFHNDISRVLTGSFGNLVNGANANDIYSKSNVSVRSFVLSEVNTLQRKDSITTMLEASRIVAGLELNNVSSQYIPKLMSVYKNTNALHLLYDRTIVGDLLQIIGKNKKNININNYNIKECSSYVISSIVQGLFSIHNLGIIYRNINMEGIMFDSNGCIALADFTLSKVIGGGNNGNTTTNNNNNNNNNNNDCKTFTICGPTNYIAPEQLNQSGHNQTVDFWSLGILLYELLTGTYPFSEKSEIATYANITEYANSNGNVPIRYTTNDVDDDAKDLISKLLVGDTTKRLSKLDSYQKHKYFINFNTDWNIIQRKSPFEEMCKKELIDIVNEGMENKESKELLLLFNQVESPTSQEVNLWADSLASR